jgi:putative membrane protein insertion efficiency factor
MRRGALLLVAGLLAAGVAVDGRSLAIEGIHVYQRTLAPLAARTGAVCRFTPTCSHYAETVIARDGLRAGGWKALGRILRCGPWTAMGTRDEP